MDFKVEVSLWNMQGANNGQAALQANTSPGFSDKLGLDRDSQSQEQRQDPGGYGVASEAGAADAAPAGDAPLPASGHPVRIHKPSAAQTAGPAELYPLGLQAGKHLSHMPYGFLQNAARAARLYGAMAGGQVEMDAGDIRLPSGRQPAAREPDMADAFAMGTARPASSAQGNQAIATEQLSLYLAQKWPERSVLLLPRGNGIELLIRDYHLTEDEQASLVADLLARLPSQAAPPGQIWVNGQCVWQRATSVSVQGEKQHGY